MISIFVRYTWSLYTQGGLADQVPVMAQIPFTKGFQAWKTEPEGWNSSILPGLLIDDGLPVCMDLTHKWTHEDNVEILDPFGKLLLAACRGANDPRLMS